MRKYLIGQVVADAVAEFDSCSAKPRFAPTAAGTYEIYFAGTEATVQILPNENSQSIRIKFVVMTLGSDKLAKAAQIVADESSAGLIPFRAETTKIGGYSYQIGIVFDSSASFLTAEYLQTVFMEGFDNAIACRAQIRRWSPIRNYN